MSKDIVILHGWGRGAKSFSLVQELLERKNYSVHVFDLPGFGAVPPPPVPWSVSDYVDFVLKFVASQNLDKFYLFGHSFGGRVGIKLAASHPEKLAGLILCDAAGVTPRPKAKIAVFGFFSKIGNWIFSFKILSIFRETARRFAYFLSGERDYYFLQDEVMRETFKKTINEDLTPYLNQIKTPTIIIWGGKDKMTPVLDAYVINKNIAGSRLEILNGIGHNPHIESPEALVEFVDNFIKNQELKTEF